MQLGSAHLQEPADLDADVQKGESIRRTRLEALAAAVAAAWADCITADTSAPELPEMASTVCIASCILSCTSSRSGSTSTSALECGTLCSCCTTCKVHKADTA